MSLVSTYGRARERATGYWIARSEKERRYLAGALGDASRELPRPPGITSIEYKERTLRVRVKPETVDPAAVRQLQAALSARSLSLEAPGPDNWLVRSTGAKP